MKKHLRMLCMSLAAAATSMAFAQEPQDFTSKLWNYDFEKGVHGWDITAESNDNSYNCWMPQMKGPEKAVGYYGYNNLALENWKGAGSGVKDNSVSQTVTDLPDGTYVFGAYMTATNDSWEPSIDVIEGVYIFANEKARPVATHRVEGMDEKWAHSIKFNVATVVKDGTLKVGAYCKSTNASFLTMDNATLWYFGEDVDTLSALDMMAKIDIERSLAIADTCVALKADTETTEYLQEQMQAAREVASAEDAYTAEEELWWGMRLMKKSAAAYAKMASALDDARAFAGQDWDEEIPETKEALDALNEVIADYSKGYEESSIIPAEVDSLTGILDEAVAVLGLENIYILLTVYEERIDSIAEYEGNEVGEYSEEMIQNATELLDLVLEELDMVGEVSAIEIKANCEAIYAKIQNIIDNPINYYEFPIFLHRSDELLPGQGEGRSNQAYPVLEGAYVKDYPAGKYGGYNVATYDSPLFRFREPLTKVRFIVHEVGADFQTAQDGRASFCLSEFSMYDENNNPIILTTENLVTNANEPKEGIGIPALIDGDYCTNFFHSLWSGSTPQAHYLEVTLPEGEYSAFRFTMVALTRNHTRAFPAEMEITYVSDEITALQQAIVKAREKNPLFGTAPGFCDIDPIYYEQVLAEGDAVVEKPGATDSEIQAAINKVNDLIRQIEEAGVKLPEPGKKYRIVSGEPRFFTNQNVMKAFTVHTDTIYGDWLWWETINPDSARQEFVLEPLENEAGKLYYAIKNVKLNRYLSELRDSAGEVIPNRFVFNEENRDSFLLKSLGQGQFGIFAEGNSREQLNMDWHNNGVATTEAKEDTYGVIPGVTSYIHTWGSNANQSSAWFFREMATLPCEAKSISELNFRSETVSIYEGINTITLTADKECAFADLKVYNTFGREVTIDEVTVDGKVATIKLASNIETFSFSFNNTEGVTAITLDGTNYLGLSVELAALQNAYNTAANKLVVKGTEVGQVVDTDEFDKAMMDAQALLENGGTAEALVAAKEAVDSAVAHLVYNLPVAGQEYFIQSALPWMTRWNSEMDLFVKGDNVYWSYVNIKNMNHRWKFVDCGELKNGMPAYYLQNVGSPFYVSTPRAEDTNNSDPVYLVEDTTEAAPFNIHFLTDGKVAITDSREGNANGSWALHPWGHQNGTGYVAHGGVITWGKHDAASAWRIVTVEKVIADFMTGIEDVEIAGEQVAPVVKGIYDLYGRRIETPAATGIYIVDGKKVLIKREQK